MNKPLLAAALAAAIAGTAHAQQPKTKAAPPAQKGPVTAGSPQPETPAQPGWSARCTSAGRDAALECAMEQTAVLTKTGQLIVLVNIRVPGDTRAPIMLVQLPLGLNLPAGAKIQVDEGKIIDLPIQTCEARGCFAGGPVAPDLLAAMRSGKQLKVSFQTLAKETVTIPMLLGDFPPAYDRIK